MQYLFGSDNALVSRWSMEEEEEDLLPAWSQDGTPGLESIPMRQAVDTEVTKYLLVIVSGLLSN